MSNQVHRLSPIAAHQLERLAASEGKKPALFLSELVNDYARGLSFNEDRLLENLPATDTGETP